jgi:hypothetical protein
MAIRIGVDPNVPTTLFAAEFDGLFKSTDSAEHWHLVADDQFLDVAVDPSDSNIVYAASSGYGIYQSADGGTSWTHMRQGESDSVAIDPVDPRIIYADLGPVMKRSKDGGATWSSDGVISSWSNVGELAFDALGSAVFAGSIGGVFRQSI